MSSFRTMLCGLAVLAIGAGCSSPEIETKRRDWSQYTGPGADVLNAPEVPLPHVSFDPNESFNRDLEGVNQDIVEYAVGPASRGWRAVTPKEGRRRLHLASTNLGFPRRAVNCALQGEWSDAGTESMRFLINTTVGLLGFFDPASDWGWDAPSVEDTGLTMVKAGWEDSDYIFVPILGPSTNRDLLGKIPDTLLDISFWIGGWVRALLAFNTASDAIPTYENLIETQQDQYVLVRMVWNVLRQAQIENFQYTKTDGDEASTQTLEAVFMQPHDPDFFRRSTGTTVHMPHGGQLPFELWMQPEPAPLAYVLPGLGSHRLSSQPVTLAESLYDGGWSVAVISNAFNFDFIENGSSVPLIGFTPADVDDIHTALDLIDQHVVETHGSGHVTGRSLMGISMGSFHTAFLAGLQEMRPDHRVQFDQFAAFALPVSLHHGVQVLDDYYEAAFHWPEDVRQDRIVATIRKALQAGDGTFRPGGEIPFSDNEAEYLIGFAFRLTLMDLIWTTQYAHNRGVLLTELDASNRTPAYAEILDYGWEEYFYVFVLPWLNERGLAMTAEEAFAAADLHYVEAGLRGNDKLWVYGSSNDFLRRPEDNAWLQQLLPPGHLTLGDSGGHLGNAWNPELRSLVLGELKARLEGHAVPAQDEQKLEAILDGMHGQAGGSGG